MKDKWLKIFGIVLIVCLFIAVIVTSIILSQKREDLDKIPSTPQTAIERVIEK